MKKVYITLLSALFAGSAFAQTLSNDRMVIFDAAGNTYPFAVDRNSKSLSQQLMAKQVLLLRSRALTATV